MSQKVIGAFVCAGLALFALPLMAAEHGTVTLRWHGQSFFEVISSAGTRIVLDPHALDAYGRIIVRADLVLVSHLHPDHSAIDVVENRDQAKILLGLKTDGRRTEWNKIDQDFRDVHIKSVPTYHDESEGLERGKNTVFVLTVDGLHIVHLGDLGHELTPKQIREIGPVDVLLIPVGGVYTINGTEARKVVAQLKPRQYIVPMHYGTAVFDEVLPVDEFLEDWPAQDIKRFEHTNELKVDATFHPRSPVIAVLNYK
jgi:L-ascorbate metabolism protein UlaG (beta-lactamase superfamily)